MKKLLMALLLAGTALAQGAEVKGSGKSVDVMKFDVRGIKLGMGQEEALKIIKEKFPDAALEEMDSEESMTTVYGKKFVQGVTVKSGKDSEFIVIFAPNALENKPKELIVSAVGLILSNTQDNLAKLQQSAVEKYGPPSVVVKGSGDYYWCHLNDEKECDEMKPLLLLGQDKENMTFGLVNFALEKATFAAAKKINQDSAGKIEL